MRRSSARASAMDWASSASKLNETRNAETAGVISTDASRVTVRVIRTDEDLMIARSVCRTLGIGVAREKNATKGTE